jgi:hypothetical protein
MMRVVYTAGRVHFLGQWLVAAFEAGRTLPSDSIWIVPGTHEDDEDE